MGDMSDFVNEGIMDEIEYIHKVKERGDPLEMYEAGIVDEMGYEERPGPTFASDRSEYIVPKNFYKKKNQEKCELCHSELILKSGRYGPFFACPNWPKCKGI